jgi:hypothetical protein
MSLDNSEKIRSLYDHGALKPHHIEKIFRDHDPDDWGTDDMPSHILSRMKDHPNPEHVAAILRSGNQSAETDLAHNKNIPYGHLKHLVDTGNADTKSALLYRDDTPHEDFNKIVNHFLDHEEDKSPVTTLTNDIRYHPDTVDKILKHPDLEDHEKRGFLARNPKIRPETIERYATHGTMGQKQTIAGNINTPTHVLEKLAAQKNPDINSELAINHRTPSHILGAMDHSDLYTAKSLAGHPNTPKEKLQELANHPAEYVSSRAKARLEKMK